jgi:spoIIIJ-associated protein
MTSIESMGKTIEEATELALEQLGVTEDEVDVEIIEEGSRGFLGLGQAPAKVRVSMKSGSSVEGEASIPSKIVSEPEAAEMPASYELIGQIGESAQEVLQKILDGIEAGGKAVLKSASEDHIDLDIVDGDAAILIGKHGQTIDAMQYLVNVIVNRQSRARLRISLDTEGYRARREEALRNQALFLADKVKQSGQEAVLEALHANERRIIHTTLADDPDVYTYSEGQEPERYVVISPKK